MEQEVIGGMAGSALLEDRDRLVELEPFGDAEGEFAGVFEFFHGEEVVPVGVVLHAGDAVGDDLCDGDHEGLAALLEGRRRNFADDQGVGTGLAEDAGRIAGVVAVDFGSGGVGGGRGDASGGESGGVGHGHVAVYANEEGGMSCGDLVEIGPGGQFVVSPEGVVPSSA